MSKAVKSEPGDTVMQASVLTQEQVHKEQETLPVIKKAKQPKTSLENNDRVI